MSHATIYFFAFANIVLLAFVLLAIRRSVFGLKTELKRNLFLLEQSERYREMFEQTDTGVCQLDAEGHFQYINQAGAKMLGFDRVEDLYDGKTLALPFFIRPNDEVRFREMLKQGESIQNQYIEIKNTRGETLYITANAREIRDEGENLIGFEGIFRDMTQRVTAQEALWSYSNNLERLVREKTAEVLALERKKMDLEKRATLGEIASALVHELRNPLSSMKMAFLAIHNRFEFDEPVARIIEDASTAGIKMERILKDVLDFARPQELRLIRQDLRPILDQAVDSFEGEYGRAGVVFHRKLPSGILMTLVDSTRLGQAVRNLLQNAVDALPDGHGEITLKTEFLQEEEVFRITVSDNGAGIAGEDQSRVFEPFFTRKDGGAGLGLTLVQKIAEAHHGRVTIESTPGRGTSVRILLPTERS